MIKPRIALMSWISEPGIRNSKPEAQNFEP